MWHSLSRHNMGDEGVRRELWDGKIPVCFKLDDDEVMMSIRGDRVAPEACYVSISISRCNDPLLVDVGGSQRWWAQIRILLP